MKIGVTSGRGRTPDQLGKGFKQAAKKLPKDIEKSILFVSEIIIGSMKKQFVGERTRAIRHGRTPSSPDDKLGVLDGTYKKSITRKVQRQGKEITALIGPFGIIYARIHEFGGTTPRGGKIRARPVLGPGVKAVQKQVEKILGESIDTTIRQI